MPLISIIIPCYNTAQYLPETLDSVFAQTLQNFEIIAVDDGSSDETLTVLHQYAEQDSRLKIIRQNNLYATQARINGIKHANGKYLVCLDSDDKLATDYLQKCAEKLENNPKIAITYSQAEFFGKKTGKWRLAEFKLPHFLLQNCIYISAMIRRSDYESVGGFDTQLTMFEDWELFIAIIENSMKNGGGLVYRIDEPLFFYRKRWDNSSLTDLVSDLKSSDSTIYIYQKHRDFYHQSQLYFHHLMSAKLENYRQCEKKYNRFWRKYFYKWFKPKKFQKIKQYIQDK